MTAKFIKVSPNICGGISMEIIYDIFLALEFSGYFSIFFRSCQFACLSVLYFKHVEHDLKPSLRRHVCNCDICISVQKTTIVAPIILY
jgi:hypothetical protein